MDSAKTLKKRPYSLFLGLCGEGSVLGRIGERTPGMTAYSGSERNNIVHEQNAYSQNDPDFRHSQAVAISNHPGYTSQCVHFKNTALNKGLRLDRRKPFAIYGVLITIILILPG
jgi:hypothetical protein